MKIFSFFNAWLVGRQNRGALRVFLCSAEPEANFHFIATIFCDLWLGCEVRQGRGDECENKAEKSSGKRCLWDWFFPLAIFRFPFIFHVRRLELNLGCADFIIYSLRRLNSPTICTRFDFSSPTWHKWKLTVVEFLHCTEKNKEKFAVHAIVSVEIVLVTMEKIKRWIVMVFLLFSSSL